jgi:hypothetical protein
MRGHLVGSSVGAKRTHRASALTDAKTGMTKAGSKSRPFCFAMPE